MKILTEADYQAAMKRLEYLIDHEPEKLTEITELGNIVDAYENDNGHAPEPPSLSLELPST